MYIDGTWNVPQNNTNVWRLKVLTALAPSAVEQLVFYHLGIGTGRTDQLVGAFGKGINRNVRECYKWLVENYEEGDRVFVFGFSRGAYIARSLLGFIERCGLLLPGGPMSDDEVFERYRGTTEGGGVSAPTTAPGEWPINRYDDLRRHSRQIPVELVGLWDTVTYHDVPLGNVRGISRSQNIFHVVEPGSSVKAVFHALAIDENRIEYRAHHLSPRPQDAGDSPAPYREERWFVGAHSNVGGGYPQDTLALIPLAWMQDKAEHAGLKFKHPVPLRGDEHLGTIVDSYERFLSGWYPILKSRRRHWREITAGPPDAPLTPDRVRESIDDSVFRRCLEDASYRPPNLVRWSIQHGISLSNHDPSGTPDREAPSN